MRQFLLNIRKKDLIVLVLTPISVFLMAQCIYNSEFSLYSANIMLANYLCIAFVMMLIMVLIDSAAVTSIITHIIFMIWAIVNYFVVLYRGNPVLPWDFTAIGTARDVFFAYTYYPTIEMYISIIYIIALSFILFKVLGKKENNNAIINRVISFALVIICFLLIGSPAKTEKFGIYTDVWNPAGAYKDNGLMATFIANIKWMEVEKPSEYEDIDNLINNNLDNEWTSVVDVKKPNIIAIMNESWSDFEENGFLELEESLFDDIKNIDNSIFGYTYTSVFGAGTSASEFEFLTGNSMAFLPSGSIPYQQYILSDTDALPSILKEQGYKTHAFHPGDATSWNRNKAYPLIGFDTYKTRGDMNVEIKESHSGYVSDKSNYDQVIYDFENRDKTNPYFYFNVTIASHGGYLDQNYVNTVKVKNKEGQYEMAEEFLTLMKEANESFLEFLEYFKNVEEPTIILMFGDHQPSLENDFLNYAYGTENGMDMKQYMGKFRAPFIIWANYDLKATEIEDTSLNYLAQYLLNFAGLKTSDYGKYLWNLKDTINALTFVGYVSDDHAYSHLETNDLTKLIKNYQAIQYDNLFGKNNRHDEFFKIK